MTQNIHRPSPFLTKLGDQLARAQAERRERMVRTAVAEWLPRGLGWLIDHPRLLRLYTRLPHRHGVPTLELRAGHPDRVVRS